MIIEFRVLAVSKETGKYDTDLIRGVFGTDHPMLDAVDHLPAQATISVITADWIPVTKTIQTPNYILVAFTR